jgi:hypothetical protein
MRFSLRSGRHPVPPVPCSRTPRSGVQEPLSGPVPAQQTPVDHPGGPLPVPGTDSRATDGRPVDGRPVDARLDDDAPATVEVVASRSTARLLESVVPATWRIVATDRPSHHPCVDFVVLLGPDPAVVAEIVERRPGAEVVVLLPRHAPTAQLVALLDAGVSICLRESPARLVAGHMLARRRRGGPGRRVPVEG